jgi:hypothetical protein
MPRARSRIAEFVWRLRLKEQGEDQKENTALIVLSMGEKVFV